MEDQVIVLVCDLDGHAAHFQCFGYAIHIPGRPHYRSPASVSSVSVDSGLSE